MFMNLTERVMNFTQMYSRLKPFKENKNCFRIQIYIEDSDKMFFPHPVKISKQYLVTRNYKIID
jgi:hypothetical protein